MTNTIRAAFSALILAGLLGAVGVAPASAMTKKECEGAWHQAKAAGQNPGTFKTYQAANCMGAAPAAAPAPAAQAAPAGAAPSGPMTRKACDDAWHQAKAAGQNPGTFKSYRAANCTGAAPAAAAPAPAAAPAAQAAPASAAPSGPMTRKACDEAWHQAKAAGQNPGTFKTYRAANCMGAEPAAAAPAAAPASEPAPAAAPAVQPAAPAPAAAPVMPAPKMTARPTGAGQFTTDTEAKGHCPTQNVVWVNTKTHIFHYAGHPRYGKTKRGVYMCEGDATAAGDRASKSEKAPK